MMCCRYDVRSPFRTQTLFSRPWFSKHRILACSNFDISRNTYMLQLCYSLFESPQYCGFDEQKNISLNSVEKYMRSQTKECRSSLAHATEVESDAL